jgi:hypothetical protein
VNSPYDIKRGSRVRIRGGRWNNRTGTLVDWDLVDSGQQRLYPVVNLDATQRGRARRVRVLPWALEQLPA